MNRPNYRIRIDHNRKWQLRFEALDRSESYAIVAAMLSVMVWTGMCAAVLFGHPPSADVFITASIVCAKLLVSYWALALAIKTVYRYA